MTTQVDERTPAWERMFAACNRLCKWRTVLAGWEFGSKGRGEGPLEARRDQIEKLLLLRAEVAGITKTLIDAGIIDREAMLDNVAESADAYAAMYAANFPGMTATDEGIDMKLPEALDTMKRMGFPP